jgi:RecA/RadA recombinase
MTDPTAKQLAELTDPGVFERIATAVLRAHEPETYDSVLHVGINAQGKTVKAPLDNVGFVHVDGTLKLVGAAHTIATKDALRRKWLHNPAFPRTGPSAPAGDLVKAIDILNREKQTRPGLAMKFALTTNRDDFTETMSEAQRLADQHHVALDFWPGSRIAHVLNFTAVGQAIREYYLGTGPTLLSREKLREVGLQSVADERPGTSISRGPTSFSGHMLLAGDPGMGKTTMALQLLASAQADGRAALVVKAQTAAESVTLAEAVSKTLRRYAPTLAPDCGVTALQLCAESTPLLVLIEDIHKSLDAERLVNKVIDWMLKPDGTRDSTAHIICPVRPAMFASVERKEQARQADLRRDVGPYTDEEAVGAVLLKAEADGVFVDTLSAAERARALGNDPLLIALHDSRRAADADAVLPRYIDDELATAASSSSFLLSDIATAIDLLAEKMLENGNTAPTWSEVRRWLAGRGEDVAALQLLLKGERLIRVTPDPSGQRIQARHDRVLHELLARAAARGLQSGVAVAYRSNPYFAEVLGDAAVRSELTEDKLFGIASTNPLVPFHALKVCAARSQCGSGPNPVRATEYAETVTNVISSWLRDPVHRQPHFRHRRYQALALLAETRSASVLELVNLFPPEDHPGPALEARFRNGDLDAGLRWAAQQAMVENRPGLNHVVNRIRAEWGVHLPEEIARTLARSGVEGHELLGALNLAGYLADPALGPAVVGAWRPTNEAYLVAAFLWAAARTCGGNPAVISPVLDAWSELTRFNGVSVSPAADVATELHVRFHDHPPYEAVADLVSYACARPALHPYILSTLRGVDHPEAVTLLVEHLGARTITDATPDALHFWLYDWERNCVRKGQKMSPGSKKRLLEISSDGRIPVGMRVAAFTLWEKSTDEGDVDVASAIGPADLRYPKAVWTRVRRGDITVIPEVLNLIYADPRTWWPAGRYVWNSDMTAALAAEVDRVVATPQEEHSLDILPFLGELLVRLDASIAESILQPRWAKVGQVPDLFQAAMYHATPVLLALAQATVSATRRPHSLFTRLGGRLFQYGRDLNRFARLEQVVALVPYLQYLQDDVDELIEVCAVRGWSPQRHPELSSLHALREDDPAFDESGKPRINVSELDSDLRTGGTLESASWFRKRSSRGAKADILISALLDWYRDNRSVRAFEIAADILSVQGGRKDLASLIESSAGLSGIAELLSAARFAIEQRSLV